MADKDRTHWENDREMVRPLDADERLAIRDALAAEEAQRDQEIRAAIQEILGEKGPMLGTELYAELKKRFPNITTSEYRRARLALGYPLDPLQFFTFIRE